MPIDLDDFGSGPPKPHTIKASHESDCPECGFSIAMGDEIAFKTVENNWVHYPRCW